MPDPDRDNLPVIRRSDGTIRTDITAADFQAPIEREPIRVVGRTRTRIPEPRLGDYRPGRATGLATTAMSLTHQFTAVLPRYLIAALILGAIAWPVTGLLWVTITAAALPLLAFLWWLNLVRLQAKEYRRGYGPPPPGSHGRL